MSRFDYDGRDLDDQNFDERTSKSEPQSRMPLSQGRGGGGAENDQASAFDLRELRERIDRAGDSAPTLDEFLNRLEKESVHPVPSIQSSGRWNGMSYEFAGVQVKGSELGRAYTASGLQTKKGIRYEPERDDRRLRALVPPTPDRPRDEPRVQHIPDPTLSSTEGRTLGDAGRFRTVAAQDLARQHYNGDHGSLQRDLARLEKLGLIERRVIPVDNRGRSLSVVALTKAGKRLVSSRESNSGSTGQAFYAGFVKPREVAHDSAIYRMYLAEARRIEAEAGKIQRVVLDYELKKHVYSELAKAHEQPPLERAELQQSVAREHHLPVVEGRIVFPDLRIEYEMPDGEARRIDLELATRNYRSSHIRDKAAGGFKVYVDSDSGRLAAVLDDHHLIAELLRA